MEATVSGKANRRVVQSLMNDPNVLVQYVRIDDNGGNSEVPVGCVVAFEHPVTKEITLSFSLCSRLDHFNYRLGKQIAIGRGVAYRGMVAPAYRENETNVITKVVNLLTELSHYQSNMELSKYAKLERTLYNVLYRASKYFRVPPQDVKLVY